MPRGIVALVFRCRPSDQPIHATDEARDVRWMSRDEITEHMDRTTPSACSTRSSNGRTPAPMTAYS